jgi:uncharacterized protein (DUF1810 family)
LVLHDVRLDRYRQAQDGLYEAVLGELRAGHKTGHWMWFVFPQLAGLGRSETSRYYSIASLQEARAYVADPILGPRLRECAAALLDVQGRTAEGILGGIDALKLRSSMTLFSRAAPDEPLFRQILERFYDGRADPATERLLDDPAT